MGGARARPVAARLGSALPQLPPGLIARPRLIAALDDGAACRLIVIAAPDGFGKTTIAADWARRLAERGAAIGWVTFAPQDDEPNQFIARLAEAIASALPGTAAALDTLAGAALVSVDTAIGVLTAALRDADDDIYLFLDDVHLLSARVLHDGVGTLLLRAPAAFHAVLVSRSRPSLPIAALEAGGGVYGLDRLALRFDLDETERLISGLRRAPAKVEEVRQLYAATEGWPIGLRILIDAGRRSAGLPRRILSAPSPVLSDYLGEKLAAFPTQLVSFMLHTSVLDKLTAPLCEAVSGMPDGTKLLATIADQHLLLTRLDDSGEWFRYPHLLSEYLRRRLAADPAVDIRGLHRRASWWFAARNMWPEAIGHAIEAGELGEARLWIEKTAMGLVTRGDLLPLLAWHAKLPPELFQEKVHVELAIAQGLTLAMRFDEAHASLNHIEQALPRLAAGDHTATGCAVLRAMLAGLRDDSEQCGTLARAGLARPDLDAWDRGVLWNCLRFEAMNAGDLDRFHTIPIGANLEETDGTVLTTIYRLALQALVAFRTLDPRAAEDRLQEANALAERNAGSGSAAAALPGGLLALVLYESDRIEEAEDLLLGKLTSVRATGMHDSVIATYTVLARIAASRGNASRTAMLLEQGEAVGAARGWPRVVAAMLAERTRLVTDTSVISGATQRLAELARAHRTSTPCSASDIPRYATLAAGRLAIAQRQHQDAIAPLGALAQEAAGCRRHDLALWADTLRAVALSACHNERAALRLLEDVAGRARRGGMLRCVLDQANLLPPAAQEHLRRLGIDARHASAGARRGASLAPREMEVLRLIAAGMSNKEIARTLSLRPETVKTYLKSVFARLSVQGRLQAVLKAQSLGLLPTT